MDAHAYRFRVHSSVRNSQDSALYTALQHSTTIFSAPASRQIYGVQRSIVANVLVIFKEIEIDFYFDKVLLFSFPHF